ncbi:uncharacterized protein L3040_008136 [Drepanopeziza brunnea f. sp. 'multigermtubi']|nr:hypothetical protein L3040_008136 [Drepanopeziza brunnea f. sp. 'multigermtubi']
MHWASILVNGSAGVLGAHARGCDGDAAGWVNEAHLGHRLGMLAFTSERQIASQTRASPANISCPVHPTDQITQVFAGCEMTPPLRPPRRSRQPTRKKNDSTDAPYPADIQTISSLRSSPPPAEAAEDGYASLPQERLGEQKGQQGPGQGQEQPGASGSPGFSTSSTVDESLGSSPILPPLPAPTFRGRTFEPRPNRTPSGSPSSSSHYYTASWGSPYQQPDIRSLRTISHSHSNTLSSETSEDSPIRHLEFHTPFLRPAPTFARLHSDPEFVSHDGLISAAVLANRARRPATGLTEDWIRQHTGGEQAERNHWLSDSGRSSLSGSVVSADWLGENNTDPQTPTLKTFWESKEKAQGRKQGPRHRRQATTDTLTQKDFTDDFLDHAVPTMSLANDGAEMEVDRPPTPPPKEWNAAGAAPAAVKSATPVLGPPRVKKKLPWKGKNITVLLPWDERESKGQAPTPLNETEMAAMLKSWEDLGYDTAGFNLGPEGNLDEGSQGQSRSPWPLGHDVVNERMQKNYRVSIPDRREWDAYVDGLKEAKLQALLGALEEERPAISPAIPNPHGRRTSMQYPTLPFSPPLPTSSAASSHLAHQQNTFSPMLVPGAGMSASQSSNPGSIASPVSMHTRIGSLASPGPMHMPGKYSRNQSISFGGSEHPFGSPFQYPQQNSPGVWSPQHMLYAQGAGGRRGSPSLQNLGAVVSPASPFSQEGYFPPASDAMSQMQQRQQLLQTQHFSMQGGARASPRLQEVREMDEDEVSSESPSKTPEARERNNPNDLQKEIDDAEYHLEEQMQRELEHDDYSPHSDRDEDKFPQETITNHTRNVSSGGLAASRFANVDSHGPVLHHPQPHSRGHSLSQRPFQESEESAHELKGLGRSDLSDIETAPSNVGTPAQSTEPSASGHDRSFSAVSNPWADPVATNSENSTGHARGHSIKASTSTLNVGAKEFTFNPANAFKPTQFSFLNSFQSPANTFTPFQNPVSGLSSHFSNPSIASSSSKSKINVSAPAFTPGHKDFNFSTSGPAFRPDAPAFTPLTTFPDSVGAGSEAPHASIFGDIDLTTLGISKPVKQNKAIPIVRPDSSHKSVENEDVEDKDGRITQGGGRFKRARGSKDDGDSIPLFAEPSMPLRETSRGQSPPKDTTAGLPNVKAGKENSAPDEDSLEEGEITENVGGKDWSPWEFHEKKQAEDFNAARPFTSSKYGSGLPGYGIFDESGGEPAGPEQEPEKGKGHKQNVSSLSAKAKPFEFRPGAFNFSFGQPSESAPKAVSVPPVPPPVRISAGLSASKYARSPSPAPRIPTPMAESPEAHMQPYEQAQFQAAIPQVESPSPYPLQIEPGESFQEQSLEDIDEVMRLMNEAETVPRQDTVYHADPPRHINMPDMENSSPIRLLPQNVMRSDAPSPSPRRFQPLPGQSRVFSRVNDDPFVAEDLAALRLANDMMDSLPPSEWDDVLSDTEEAKLQPRAQFFDNHVNDLVGGLLSQRIEPLERTLENIQMSLDMMAARGQSTRRERRSISGALSDADDEDDDDQNPRRSMSPKRNQKLDRIKAIVVEALASHQSSRPATGTEDAQPDSKILLQAIEEMKEQLGSSMRHDLRIENIRNIVEDAVGKRLPVSPKPLSQYIDEAAREASFTARIAELEERLMRVDGDTGYRSTDLEETLLRADMRTEEETKQRRAAEDRLAEVQRLLRISSEEETRLREAIDEREKKIREIIDSSDAKVRNAEEQCAKTEMRIALLETSHENTQKSFGDLQNRHAMTGSELRDARLEIHRLQLEAERIIEGARRHSEDAEMANETNKELRRTLESLRAQMEESIRVREGMRGRLTEVQAELANAALSITAENASRAKKEAELVARQEVLDARLQAEARTRERLEQEIERLEKGEREGMRAVSDLRKMVVVLDDLRKENDEVKRESMRYKREFEEARESGMSEVQRTRHYMQVEVDTANNQVNVVREDLENQILRLRTEIDQVKLDADTTRAKSEMLLEEAESSKQSELDAMKMKHADVLEDLQTQHERQLSNAVEDAQRHEQHLLERLSLSSAKTEHLQDRVTHLEDKLEVASQAARAAASAAKTARSASSSSPTAHGTLAKSSDLPEKISPQALRESIMVLQEQLQARESTIEDLEQQLSTADPEAPKKIEKRDDEIIWLRELLSVRKSDLTDIVSALETGRYDPDRVRDAAIRLRANLQMEEQERERAMNGGSAVSYTVDGIAKGLRDVASPRVAQAVGPLAAVWGNWRKGRAVDVDGGSGSSTPLRTNSPGNQSLLTGLLTPPANSTPRTSDPLGSESGGGKQPSAFGSTGQRFTSAQLANRPRNPSARPLDRKNPNQSMNNGPSSSSRENPPLPSGSRQSHSVRGSPTKSTTSTANTVTTHTTRGLRAGSGNFKRGTFGGGMLGGQEYSVKGAGIRMGVGGREGVTTPPMMRTSSYDLDARAEDFSDAGFYDDESFGGEEEGEGEGDADEGGEAGFDGRSVRGGGGELYG